MSKRVQRRRGTSAEHTSGTGFTGEIGEITVDTTANTIRIHDGTTKGGHPLSRADASNLNLTDKINVNELNLVEGQPGQVLQTDGAGTISFTDPTVGGDLSGTIKNAQIVADSVGVTELNVSAGIAGQALTINGAGALLFADVVTDPTVGGDLSGTTSNAQIVANAVGAAEIATDSVSVNELNVAEGQPNTYLKTDGNGNLSFEEITSGGSSTWTEDLFTGDGSTTVFTFTQPANVDGKSILVYVDGVNQPLATYTQSGVLTSTTSMTISPAPHAGAAIRVLHLGIYSEGLASGSSNFVEDIMTGDGSATTFNFPSNQTAPSLESILVHVDGVAQPKSAYTLPTTTSIGITPAPYAGAAIRVLHLGVAGATGDTVVGGDVTGTVSNIQIAANAVDGTHIQMGSDAPGDVLYYDGTNYIRLPKGTAGQALVMNAGATAPEWGAGGGGSSGYYQDVYILQDIAEASLYKVGTWTKPAGVSWMEYTLIGAGGKGGSGHVNSGSQLAVTGGPGGFGGKVVGIVSPEEMSTITSIPYTIGRGYIGHVSTGSPGTGITTFGQTSPSNTGVTVATAVPVVTSGVITGVTVTPGSAGNTPNLTGIPCRVLINYNAQAGANGTGAVITANVNGSGAIDSCTIVSGGTGYVQNETQICIGLGWAGMGYNGGNGIPGDTGGDNNNAPVPSVPGAHGENGNNRSMGSNNNVLHADFGARDAVGQPQPYFESAQAGTTLIEGSGGSGSGGTVPAHWFGWGGLIHLRLYK